MLKFILLIFLQVFCSKLYPQNSNETIVAKETSLLNSDNGVYPNSELSSYDEINFYDLAESDPIKLNVKFLINRYGDYNNDFLGKGLLMFSGFMGGIGLIWVVESDKFLGPVFCLGTAFASFVAGLAIENKHDNLAKEIAVISHCYGEDVNLVLSTIIDDALSHEVRVNKLANLLNSAPSLNDFISELRTIVWGK